MVSWHPDSQMIYTPSSPHPRKIKKYNRTNSCLCEHEKVRLVDRMWMENERESGRTWYWNNKDCCDRLHYKANLRQSERRRRVSTWEIHKQGCEILVSKPQSKVQLIRLKIIMGKEKGNRENVRWWSTLLTHLKKNFSCALHACPWPCQSWHLRYSDC